MEGLTLHRPVRASDRIALVATAPGAAGWLLALLLATCAYAAFAGGAVAIPAESRLQVGIAGGVLLGGLGLASGALRVARSPLAWAGVGLLVALALWSALSAGWSAAPDESWLAANRITSYAAVVALALVAAPVVRAAPAVTLFGFVAIGTAVALYALAGKLAPEARLGPIDLAEASQFGRLREPLGYWNALGLLVAMAVPACLWIAGGRERPGGLRIGALVCMQILLVALALTYSRGAIVALAAAVIVYGALSGNGLRTLGLTAAAAAAAAPPVAFAFSRPDLTGNAIPAAERSADGALLAIVLLGSMLALVGTVRMALRSGSGRRWSARRRRGAWRLIGLLAFCAMLAGIVAADGARGIGGTVAHEWREFRQPQAPAGDTPARLLSSSSSNRWSWWREAAGAFWDRPLAGWGAGSFPIVHNLYREQPTEVRSAHSLPLQLLAEYGILGAALAFAGLGLLGLAAVRETRAARGPGRAARAALLAAAAAWAVHGLYDWGWEIPAVTLPALIAVAVAAVPRGSPAQRSRRLGRAAAARRQVVPPGAIAAAATVLAVLVASSAAFPWLSERARLQAQVAAREGTTLELAASRAALARRLNPYNPMAALAGADIELRRGNLRGGEEVLAEAARRHPDNHLVWQRLAEVALVTGNNQVARIAVARWVQATPLTAPALAATLPGIAFLSAAPPDQSPTALGTPPGRERGGQQP